MEERSTLYSYAIVAQKVHQERQKYMWEKYGKYKKLIDAEKAIADFSKEKLQTMIFKIIPYFEGYWWTDVEMEQQEYKKTNRLLWDYLNSKKLADEARSFIKDKRKQYE